MYNELEDENLGEQLSKEVVIRRLFKPKFPDVIQESSSAHARSAPEPRAEWKRVAALQETHAPG